MNGLRHHFLAKISSLITGAIFLNMSFFLAEVSLLEINNPDIIENVAKLFSSTGFEEERDGEAASDSDVKEVDVMINQINLHHCSLFLIATKTNHTLEDHYPHANYSQTFSPPPDFQFSA